MPLSSLHSKPEPQKDFHHSALIHRLTSGHILTITPDSQGGLLLVKPFYTDFAGPGAAIGGEFDRSCTAVYPVGNLRFQTLLNQRDRQDALHTRITYVEQLSVILDNPYPLQRAQLMTRYLADCLPGNLSLTVSAELIAGLAGVLPDTVRFVWHTYKEVSDERLSA